VTGRLGAPEDIAFDAAGNLYFSEFSGNRVDELTLAGVFRLVAGTGTPGYSGDGGPAIQAELNAPTGLVFDPAGNLLIADHHNGCVRRVSPAGAIRRIVGRCGHEGFSGDGGPAISARLNDPIGIALDRRGNLFIDDEQNHRIRKVGRAGLIHTIAGNGSHAVAGAPEGILASRLRLSHPSYLAIGSGGALYFSDFWANVVMRIGARGRAWHVAGTGKPGYSGDGGPAGRAAVDFPTGIAFGPGGRLYVSNTDFARPAKNNRIRVIGRHGVIRTVVDLPGIGGYTGDGGPAGAAEIAAPSGLGVDRFGRLVIADQGNDVVRRVSRSGTIRTVVG
jgi:DNA-binding beta-propeller fold protein YncE